MTAQPPGNCPKCGTKIPTEGHCPRCLLGAGIAQTDLRFHSEVDSAPKQVDGASERKAAPTVSLIQDRFPQFEIIDLIGHGGMGAVYKVRQHQLDRTVALKVLLPEIVETSGFAERFAREARALGKLNHQNIVQVYESGQQAEFFYILMEYVDGVNLRQAIEESRMSPHEAMAIVPQICAALQFAHDEGVVHRDIKPENILLGKRGQVKIADFGLAKMAVPSDQSLELTATHQVMGTYRYMSPEQLSGAQNADHRSDIFSLGVVFYELLTGNIPTGHFELPSQLLKVDVRVDEVVLRSLAQQPSKRYQLASTFKSDIEDLQSTSANDQAMAEEVTTNAPAFDSSSALSELRGPAIGLMLTGVIGCLMTLVAVVVNRQGVDLSSLPFILSLGIPVNAFVLALSVLQGVVVICCGWTMLHAKSYQLARAAAILPLVPLHLGWVVGIACSGWALVVLRRPHVRKVLPGRDPYPAEFDATFDVVEIKQRMMQFGVVGMMAGFFYGSSTEDFMSSAVLGFCSGICICVVWFIAAVPRK